MRYFLLALPLLLAACTADTPNTAVATAAENTQQTLPNGQPVPADQQMTGDAKTDAVIASYAHTENLYQTGMLQRKDVAYECDKIIGRVQLYTNDGEFTMAINTYNDGPSRSVTDRTYYLDGEPVYYASESVTWEIIDDTQTDASGNVVATVRTSIANYRYFIEDGKVFKFLKKKYESYSNRTDNVDPNTVAETEAPTNGNLPVRIAIVDSAREQGEVSCDAFQVPAS